MILEDKQLIGQIKELRQIKPRKDWVSSTKMGIMGQEPKFSFFPYLKPAFAGFAAICLFGTLGFSLVKNSLPGDVLYVLRKAAHEGQAVFVSQEEKSAYQLKLANDRLEDLTKAPIKNVGPTIDEFQANIMAATKNLGTMDVSTSSSESLKKLVEETKKLEENKQKIESLGVFIDENNTSEFENVLKNVVTDLIEDLEGRTLDTQKEALLARMKELTEEGRYSEALELYLIKQ